MFFECEMKEKEKVIIIITIVSVLCVIRLHTDTIRIYRDLHNRFVLMALSGSVSIRFFIFFFLSFISILCISFDASSLFDASRSPCLWPSSVQNRILCRVSVSLCAVKCKSSSQRSTAAVCVCIVDVVTTCILIAARSVSRQNALYLKILWDEYCTFVSITNIYHHSAAGIPPHVILIDFFFLGKSSGQSPRRQIHTGNQRLHLKAPVKAVDGRWLRTKCLDGSTQSNAIYLLHAWFCVKERKRERAHCARVEFTLRRQPYTISHGDDPGRILAQR